MSDLKPLKLYYRLGPNPFKVEIILRELDVPFEKVQVDDPKCDWFVAVNPNGRVPAVIDPNNNITVWESGAIIEYLVDTYDKEGKLTVTSLASKWQLKQYLHFQMSGQGPYFGQCLWFYKEHHDDQPSAKERYAEHTIRVVQVFENIIKDKTYLVDDKVTYADLAWFPWFNLLTHPLFLRPHIWERYEVEKNYPHFMAWYRRLADRPSIAATYAGIAPPSG